MPHLSPTTLTSDEQALILHVTQPNLRDHVIYSLALGTGLRLAEIVGLNVCDLYAPDGTPRVRVRIRKEIAKGGRAADVFLPDRLVVKLRNFWSWKRRCGEDLDPDAPLFANQSGCRISKRRVQHAWSTWQRRAGFDRVYGFHALRHTAVTNVYRASRDLFLAQRFARHVSPLTTTVYTTPRTMRPNGGCPRGRSLAILYWRGVPMVSLIIAAAASGVSTSITNLWKCSWSSSTTIVFSGWWTSQNTRPPSW